MGIEDIQKYTRNVIDGGDRLQRSSDSHADEFSRFKSLPNSPKIFKILENSSFHSVLTRVNIAPCAKPNIARRA